MPSQDEIAKFRAGENNWSQDDIKRTEAYNALAQLVWTDEDEKPGTSVDYENQVQRIYYALEKLGYQVQRRVNPPHMDERTHTMTLHKEELWVHNGWGNVIAVFVVRDGGEVSGVRNAESWVRNEIQERDRNELRRKRLEHASPAQLQAVQDAYREEELTLVDLAKQNSELLARVAQLEKKLAGDAQG